MRPVTPKELRDIATCIERNIARASSEVRIDSEQPHRYSIGVDDNGLEREMRQAQTMRVIIEVEMLGPFEYYEGGAWVVRR